MKTMLKRGAGVLMPIFSLPSPYGIGTFGRAAYEFIDQLKRGRQTYWQVLPMGPTCYGDSPYQSYSAFAGNPYFIDLDTLKDEKLLTRDEIDACWWCDKQDQVKYDALYYYRFPLLRKAYERSGHKESVEYQAFLEENEEWLDDYALYMAVKGKYEGKGWMDWDEDIRFRRPEALSACREELAEEINYWKFLQFKFFEQWKKLKQYAKEKELQIELTEAAKDFVVEGGYDPMYGARPLKRFLQKHVDTLAAKLMLQGDVGAQDTIIIDVEDGKLVARSQSVCE